MSSNSYPAKVLARLRENIINSFNISEVKTLCDDLGLDYEGLSGDSLPDKARELIRYCVRRDMINDLVDQCAHLRTDKIWYPVDEVLLEKIIKHFSRDELFFLLQDIGIYSSIIPRKKEGIRAYKDDVIRYCEEKNLTSNLIRALVKRVSSEDLIYALLDIGIYDDIIPRKDEEMSVFVMETILYCERNNLIMKLKKEIIGARPFLADYFDI